MDSVLQTLFADAVLWAFATLFLGGCWWIQFAHSRRHINSLEGEKETLMKDRASLEYELCTLRTELRGMRLWQGR